jgi:hypothetical protein
MAVLTGVSPVLLVADLQRSVDYFRAVVAVAGSCREQVSGLGVRVAAAAALQLRGRSGVDPTAPYERGQVRDVS